MTLHLVARRKVVFGARPVPFHVADREHGMRLMKADVVISHIPHSPGRILLIEQERSGPLGQVLRGGKERVEPGDPRPDDNQVEKLTIKHARTGRIRLQLVQHVLPQFNEAHFIPEADATRAILPKPCNASVQRPASGVQVDAEVAASYQGHGVWGTRWHRTTFPSKTPAR